jgi:hypothetical protein
LVSGCGLGFRFGGALQQDGSRRVLHQSV